jgi:hypothetical protein
MLLLLCRRDWEAVVSELLVPGGQGGRVRCVILEGGLHFWESSGCPTPACNARVSCTRAPSASKREAPSEPSVLPKFLSFALTRQAQAERLLFSAPCPRARSGNFELNVVGDFDAAELERLVLGYVGTIRPRQPPAPLPAHPIVFRQPPHEERHITWHLKAGAARGVGVRVGLLAFWTRWLLLARAPLTHAWQRA